MWWCGGSHGFIGQVIDLLMKASQYDDMRMDYELRVLLLIVIYVTTGGLYGR